MSLKIENTPYIPVKQETIRSAPAAAEEKNEAAADSDRDTVQLGATADKPVTYAPPKKLSSEQVQSMKTALTTQQMELLKAMAGDSIKQANSWLASKGKSYGNNMMDRFALPELATDPAGAKAAISEGGAYSVDAVATRIFDMASAMAGDDPKMLEKMQDAVKKGFEAAGLDFKKAVGQSLPSICNDTYDEVMKRFENRFAELSGTAKQ